MAPNPHSTIKRHDYDRGNSNSCNDENDAENSAEMRNSLEEGTQTEMSGNSSVTFSDTSPDNIDDDSSETESVMERFSRLFHSSRRDRGTQTAKDPVACETEKLVYDVVFFTLGKRSALPGDDDVVKCMRHSVAKVLQNHAITFNAMMSRISLNRTVDIQEGFCELTDEVFNEGHVTWARIVTFFAFGARLAVWCTERGMSDLVFEVVSNMSQVAVDRLIPFLRDNGGWATFCEAFPMQHDYEGKIWRSLVITGMGLTAIATLLAFQRSS